MNDLNTCEEFCCFSLLGGGKTAIGTILPVVISPLRKPITVSVICVRNVDAWKAMRANHKTGSFIVKNDLGETVYTQVFEMNAQNESFTDFCARIHISGNVGVWVYDDENALKEALDGSAVVGTSVGAEAFKTVLPTIVSISPNTKAVYAFENQPNVIADVAKKYPDIRIVHCPIDRVVVNRHFDIETGCVTATLGSDPKLMVMIFDIDGFWTLHLDLSRSCDVVLTHDESKLSLELEKKFFFKNFVHKMTCHHAISHDPSLKYSATPLREVVNEFDAEKVRGYRTAVVIGVMARALRRQVDLTTECCKELFDEFAQYYDDSLAALLKDKSDTIGRIIHLDSVNSYTRDKDSLINNIETLRSYLHYTNVGEIIDLLGCEAVGPVESLFDCVKEMLRFLDSTTAVI